MPRERKLILQEIDNLTYLAECQIYPHQLEVKLALLRKANLLQKKLGEYDIENKGTYFLCSQSVIDHYKPTFVSKWFRSGYKDDEKYYIALINSFEDIEEYYKEFEDSLDSAFCCWELVSGLMEATNITLSGMKKNGVFVEIQNKIGLTTEKNIAMTLYNISERFNCTPIELINKIH